MNKLTPHQTIALNYHDHISLTANAGSGKTFVVTKRFVEIALKEKIPLNKIVAITFTDKAASELYKKISECIEELLKNIGNESEIKQLEVLRRQLVSANISTIHSFCLNILKEFPVEAEIDANFIPIDEKLSSELIEMAVDKMIKESLKDDDKDRVKKLIRMFSSSRILAGELESLVKNYVKILFIERNIYSKSSQELKEYYNSIITEYFDKLIRKELPTKLNYLITINKAVLIDNPDNPVAQNVLTLINKLNPGLPIRELITKLFEINNLIITKGGSIAARGYIKTILKEKFIKECGEIESLFKQLNIFISIENEKDIWNELYLFGTEILYFFRKSLANYEESKTENGYLDYEDILYKTYTILKNPGVKEYLSDKYRYLMIDEYQDTNELQYNIFLPIVDNLKSGNLLVVGDEKQSIYMFRDAELEVFRKTSADIVGISGLTSLLKLPDSFRMKQELCCFTNILFKNLFNNPDPLYNEVEHSDLICAGSEKDHGEIEVLFNRLSNDSDQTESDLVVKKLINMVNNGEEKYKWGDIAVLCRKRKTFSELEKKFAEYNVPFIIMGGKEFFQRQSIYDIYNYFSFLLENKNDTALVGLLRSPFFAFSDDDIYNLSFFDGRTYWQKLVKIKDEDPKWEKAYQLLKENILLSNDLDFASLLRKILKESNFLANMAVSAEGIQEIANIEKLTSLTSNFMNEGYKTLYDYVNYLKLSIEEKDDEPQASLSEESDAVKIMTLHQAKGLEFPVVVLYKCNETTKRNSIKTKSILTDKTLGLLTKIPLNDNYYSPYISTTINNISDYVSEKKELAESKRIFYVGITRAKDHLIISFESNEEAKLQYGSFIWMLQKGLNIDLQRDLFEAQSNLTFLVNKDGNYINKEKSVPIKIPIIKNIQFASPIVHKSPITTEKILKINTVEDHLSGDIISATRFSVFNLCPVKYYLRYDVGLNQIDIDFTHSENIDASGKQELTGQLKGRIIHSILEQEIKKDDLIITAGIIIDKEKMAPALKRKLLSDIQKEMDKYYSSDIYNEISTAKKFKNEYEIHLKLDDFYLYGRIDKVIFSDNKITIIDYKTDYVIPKNIKDKTGQYYSQVKFYSYLLSKLFTDINKFEMHIIYIKNPDANNKYELNREEFPPIENEIKSMIKSIKTREYHSEINHCRECIYSINKIKCIRER
jgi:ATP-dependent helicase/nuclease subunit A